MSRLTIHAVLAAGLLATLAILDFFTNTDPFRLADFAQDIVEWTLMSFGVAAASYVVLGLHDAGRRQSGLAADLDQARAEGNRWRAAVKVHTEGLGHAVRTQFDTWRLTAGEADVAILMLKGLSHKEIANLRQSSAATVRQQAAAVYAKSGLSSRAELAAYFLEDVFPSEEIRNGSPAVAAAPAGAGLPGIPHMSEAGGQNAR